MSELLDFFDTLLTGAGGPTEQGFKMAFSTKLRLGEGRGILWRHHLGVLSAPPPSVLAKLRAGSDSSSTDSSSSSASSTDSDSDDDGVFDHYEAAAEVYRKPFAKWLEDRIASPASPPPGVAGKPAGKGAARKQKGPRFADDSSDSDSEGFETLATNNEEGGLSKSAGGSDNPLDASDSSKWGQYFAKQKILELVDKDLGRLWGGEEFFEDPALRASMREVLEAILDTGIVTDYCQGMHELLSLIMLVLTNDAQSAAQAPRDKPHYHTLRLLCSTKYLKHDAYVLLRAMLTSKENGLGMARWYEVDPDFDLDRPVVKLSEKIQNAMLTKSDPPLSQHLKKLDITPASYGLRWLRLLFLREFPFAQSAQVWDSVFASHAATGRTFNENSIIPHLAVAMLIFIRQDLLDDDYGMVLRRLMRFPPVEGVQQLLQRAAIGAYGSDSPVAQYLGVAPSLLRAVPEAAEAPPLVTRSRAATAMPVSSAAPVVVPAPRARSPSPPQPAPGDMPPSLVAAAPITTKVSSPTSPSRGPTRREQDVGAALSRVIDTMGTKWFPDADGVPDDDADPEYVLAIAELKRLRDVLLHGLPLE